MSDPVVLLVVTLGFFALGRAISWAKEEVDPRPQTPVAPSASALHGGPRGALEIHRGTPLVGPLDALGVATLDAVLQAKLHHRLARRIVSDPDVVEALHVLAAADQGLVRGRRVWLSHGSWSADAVEARTRAVAGAFDRAWAEPWHALADEHGLELERKRGRWRLHGTLAGRTVQANTQYDLKKIRVRVQVDWPAGLVFEKRRPTSPPGVRTGNLVVDGQVYVKKCPDELLERLADPEVTECLVVAVQEHGLASDGHGVYHARSRFLADPGPLLFAAIELVAALDDPG